MNEWKRERAEKLFFEIQECTKKHPIECMRVFHIERALDEVEKRGFEKRQDLNNKAFDIGRIQGHKEMRERAASILPKFGELQDERLLKLAKGIAELILSLPIEGE